MSSKFFGNRTQTNQQKDTTKSTPGNRQNVKKQSQVKKSGRGN
jgi:hypothetical protein